MGANAATQAHKIIENVERILAIELLNASQALAFRAPLKSSHFLEMFLQAYREEVPFINEDEVLHYAIKSSINFLQNLTIDSAELLS
jgi:histidine ammonia-lyase